MSAKDVFDLVLGAIEVIKISIEIYKAVQDKSGIPDQLRKVSERLPSLLEILQSAEAQYTAEQPDRQTWITAEADVKHCKETCQELQDLLRSAYPKADSGKVGRFFKGTQTVLSGKGKTAEQLLAETYKHLKLLVDRQILTNTAALDDIKKTLDELLLQPGLVQRNEVGDNIGRDQYNNQNLGSGQMFTGAGGAYSFHNTINEINHYAISPREQDDKYEHLYLQSLYPSNRRKRQNLGEKTEGTCGWINRHEQYLEWTRKGGSLLISGRPGTGKSTLVDSMIDESTANLDSNQATVVASFFFHRRGSTLQHSPLGLFRSLLHQILTQDKSLLAKLVKDTRFEKRYEDEGEPGPGKRWDWTESEVKESLTACLQTFLRDRILWLYIDGLDESGEAHARDVWNYLKKQLKQNEGHLNVCIACRPYPDVVFDPEYSITIDDETDEDMTTYLQVAFKAEPRWQARADLEDVQNTLKARACGVFQWVVFTMPDILGLHSMSKDFIFSRIEKAPVELSILYQKMLQSMAQKSRADGLQALQILRWITFAGRPLSLRDLRYAIATDPDSPLPTVDHCERSRDWCDSDDAIANRVGSLSCGLAKVVDNGEVLSLRTVEFDHESVQEYMLKGGIEFLENQIGLTGNNGDVIGRAHHILYSILLRHMMTGQAKNAANWMSYYALPLLDYAATQWMVHAKIADDHGFPLEEIVDLTGWPTITSWVHWQKMLERQGELDERSLQFIMGLPLELRRIVERARGIDQTLNATAKEHGKKLFQRDKLTVPTTLQHVAAKYGLHGVLIVLNAKCKSRKAQRPRRMLHLLSRRADDIDVEDDHGRTPLSWAAGGGHESTVQELLATGKVDVNRRDKWGRSPLMQAVLGGHEGTVNILLAIGKVDPDREDISGHTPLWEAAKDGHEGIVGMLLATGKVDADPYEDWGQTPIWVAIKYGHEAIAKLLLATGKVDLNQRSLGFDSLVSVANCFERKNIAKLLEDYKPD